MRQRESIGRSNVSHPTIVKLGGKAELRTTVVGQEMVLCPPPPPPPVNPPPTIMIDKLLY